MKVLPCKWVALLLVVLWCCVGVVSSFSCLAEDRNTKTIPDTHVNDNYCDCTVDGEDEPATHACSFTNARKFVCEGDWDRKAISSAFVNDRICDCCDGSDEKPGACQNTCEQERAKAIAKAKKEMELQTEGDAIKRKYIKQANQEYKDFLSDLKKLKKEVQLEEEDLQAKIHSQAYDQQTLMQLYNKIAQRQQTVQNFERLASTKNSFGSRREYYTLLGECFTKTSNEKHFKGGSFEPVAGDYKFELCPFRGVTQSGTQKGAKPTLLGLWHGWDDDNTGVMIYKNGEECWNGPERVVRVHLSCGLKDELIDVREDGKCTYEFNFTSPAACDKKYADKMKKYIAKIAPELKEQEIVHDEL